MDKKLRYKLTINPHYESWRDFMLNIENFFHSSHESIHKARNELKVILYQNTDVVIKAFRVPNIINQLIYGNFRNSKAQKSYDNALMLLELGICTPKPIGYIEFYHYFLFKKSFFVTEKYHYDFTIREPLLNKNFADRENIFKAFAAFTLMLHNKGVYHKDYSPGNILIKKLEEGYEFCLVDINRMEFAPLDLNTKLFNFTKLWIDDEDLAFVMHEYCLLGGLDFKTLSVQAINLSNKYKASKEMRRKLKRKVLRK